MYPCRVGVVGGVTWGRTAHHTASGGVPPQLKPKARSAHLVKTSCGTKPEEQPSATKHVLASARASPSPIVSPANRVMANAHSEQRMTEGMPGSFGHQAAMPPLFQDASPPSGRARSRILIRICLAPSGTTRAAELDFTTRLVKSRLSRFRNPPTSSPRTGGPRLFIGVPPWGRNCTPESNIFGERHPGHRPPTALGASLGLGMVVELERARAVSDESNKQSTAEP